ncbi:pyrimidine-nucleoside phosphorylase [Paracholeplasma manati]|uniref:Pyrimidine-nucleoside phosphorylase n=1 Tax=Paracholeplasma manati TaxID=591373 RepID=A0ABT2YBP5_9MOLU|nr:pyrimidine-nucleoside phosphorylase [Paracholeplasma manati]MCV2232158.1 pyrimidine-nucleoside phosphorylase [Paracholeplasma manati]MDG0888115.1 pyrimidine-nucleoside phosphorylase [Paracholeplasma manati]
MRMLDLITKKRDGYALTKAEIEFIVHGYTQGNIPDYQMSSFLMATYFNGMTDQESTDLAIAMMHSGDTFNLDDIDGIKVDKHSTGGVGDKVTLVLGPLVAACGAKFAKMSGRGLGHTGGTLDKLESIPGYNIVLDEDAFKAQVNKIGISVIGQSKNITPADKKMYALRDVTGTVPSIPLIASSIMSKKLASGADAICLDVKVGNGAFMTDLEEAKKLAILMVQIGKLAGKSVKAILTNMDEPLGFAVGNTLEVIEAIETLKGQGPKDLESVVLEIGSYLLEDAGIASKQAAMDLLKSKLHNGEALNKLVELVKAQGGDASFILNPEKFVKASQILPLVAKEDGYIDSMVTIDIGLAAAFLGAGRETVDGIIDPAVGIVFKKKIGDYVRKGDVILEVHANQKGVQEAMQTLEKSIKIGQQKHEVVLIEGVIL